VRTATFVLISSALLAVGLHLTAPPPPTTTAAITSLTLPSEIYVGERIGLRASVFMPVPESLDRRFSFCHLESGACATAGWGGITSDGHFVGFAGNLRTREPGTTRVTWTLHAPWDVDSNRAVHRVLLEVRSRATPE